MSWYPHPCLQCTSLPRAELEPSHFYNHNCTSSFLGLVQVGNLPLVFVGPLCQDKKAIFYRALGETCEEISIAYIAFDIAGERALCCACHA
mgnify:CR=1 FL=1